MIGPRTRTIKSFCPISGAKSRWPHRRLMKEGFLLKPRKTGDPVTTSYPDEASASTATEALRQGNERPVGHYTRALVKL